jgi:DNA-binding ferritin-like protein
MVQFVQGGLERLNSYRHEVAHQATESGDSATAKLREVFADGQEKTERMLRACLSS